MTDQPPGTERTRHHVVHVALGFVLAIGLIALLFLPSWVMDLGLVALSLGLVWWFGTVSIAKLRTERGLPRASVFSFGGFGIVTALFVTTAFDRSGLGRLGLTLSLGLIVVAVIVGLVRVALAFGR